jgi:hypothetical protein
MVKPVWTPDAARKFRELEEAVLAARANRQTKKQTKSSKQEGLFKQVREAIAKLEQTPRHPGLNTHEYDSIPNPYDKNQKVFEAYAQNKTPGAYRIFWCYGPGKQQITILAITPHP